MHGPVNVKLIFMSLNRPTFRQFFESVPCLVKINHNQRKAVKIPVTQDGGKMVAVWVVGHIGVQHVPLVKGHSRYYVLGRGL